MIPIQEWLPDQYNLNGGTTDARNLVPRANSYSPFPSFMTFSTNGLTNRVQGAAAFRSSANAIGHYAGDSTRLYRLVSGTTWTDSSGTTYATGADNVWNFAQFGQLAIAVNGLNAPQKITVGSGTTFSNLGGSPPTARYIAIVRDFVFLGNLSTDRQSVRWSAINDAESWTIGTNQADVQPIPDGGWIQGIVGGEFGLVFSEFAINRFTYTGGDEVFQRDQITNEIGATISGSIAGYGAQAFFCHRTGFYSVVGGQEIRPIGAERVNNFFWANLNQNYIHRVTSCVDPENNLYVVSYPNINSSDGTPNELLVYNWVVNKWSRVLPGNHQMIYRGLSAQQWTLEQISATYPNLENVPYSLDSSYWTGVGRLLLSSFDTLNQSSAANGPNLAAFLDSQEFMPIDGKRSFLKSFRPLINLSDGTISARIFHRTNPSDTITATSFIAIDGNGRVNIRISDRYYIIRLLISAGATWTHIKGFDDLRVSAAGRR